MNKAKRVAIYLRVSTDGQTTENQRMELARVAELSGWTVVEVYEDAGISGAKGREGRPAFHQLCHDATRRRFDMVAAWSVDRLGRSLQHLVTFLEELRALGIDLYLHQQGLDTSTPAGRAMFQMAGVFAEFERGILQERTRAGMARAKAKGKVFGRPRKSTEVEAAILGLRAQGQGMNKIAKHLGVGVSVVQRVVRESAEASTDA